MSDITIISHKRSNNFTIVPNHIINADYLKLEDKAFLIWVLSKPADWKLNTLSLAKIHGVCKDKITTISKRLQKHNHLIIKKGAFGKAQWFIFENAQDCADFKCTPKNTPVDPVLNPYPEKQDELHPEIHDPEKQDALLRTDPLPRTDQEKTSSSDAEHIDIQFSELWEVWPNAKNKIRSITAFKAKVKGKSPNAITQTVNGYKIDIQKRLAAQQLGFSNMMLSTYLNGERYNDDITNGNNESVAEIDHDKQNQTNKTKEWLKEQGY